MLSSSALSLHCALATNAAFVIDLFKPAMINQRNKKVTTKRQSQLKPGPVRYSKILTRKPEKNWNPKPHKRQLKFCTIFYLFFSLPVIYQNWPELTKPTKFPSNGVFKNLIYAFCNLFVQSAFSFVFLGGVEQVRRKSACHAFFGSKRQKLWEMACAIKLFTVFCNVLGYRISILF